MSWSNVFAVVCIGSDVSNSHIVQRGCIEKLQNHVLIEPVTTVCGIRLPLGTKLTPLENHPQAVNCSVCVTESELQLARREAFLRSPDAERAIRILSGAEREFQRLAKIGREIDDFERNLKSLNKVITDCMSHTKPVFTLELPDDVLLKLTTYSCVGEVLLAFKLGEDTRKLIYDALGRDGFSIVGSRLISKGYLRTDDPIFYT